MDRKLMSTLRESRSSYIPVPHRKKLETTVLKPVFYGVYTNTDDQHSHMLTVMVVSDRAEAWSIYKKMSKCPFAWLYGHWVFLGYIDSMIRSLI
jgi:hypothetical protein